MMPPRLVLVALNNEWGRAETSWGHSYGMVEPKRGGNLASPGSTID
jgi:hypothetical protein